MISSMGETCPRKYVKTRIFAPKYEQKAREFITIILIIQILPLTLVSSAAYYEEV